MTSENALTTDADTHMLSSRLGLSDETLELADRLQDFMRTARPHLNSALRLCDLSQKLCVSEFKLRRLINKHLGYANFNAFVNALRVREARRMLTTPEQSEATLDVIAIAVGFRSAVALTRAFKASENMTPEHFRSIRKADYGRDDKSCSIIRQQNINSALNSVIE